MRTPGFRLCVQCAECPWRKDVQVGRFPPERFDALRSTVGQGMRPLFACHKSPEEHPDSCVGYLAAVGMLNWTVRMAAARGEFDPEELRVSGAQYKTYDEMAVANGCASKEVDESEPLAVSRKGRRRA